MRLLIGIVLGALVALTLPQQAMPERGPDRVEVFYGILSSLDGRDIGPSESRLSISLQDRPNDPSARRYRLYVDCKDVGFRSADGAWTSFTGATGAEYAAVSRCPEADPSRYNRVTEIMSVGGDLQLGKDELVLTSRLGEARFRLGLHPTD